MSVQPIFETPYERRGILTPGLPILPHGVERHPIPPNGSRAVPVSKGDEITLLNREGLQVGELVFFAPDGSSDAGMLGGKGRGRPEGVISVLADGSRSGQKVMRTLSNAGFELSRGDAVTVFKKGARAGDTEVFHAACDGLLIAAAPGGPMRPDAQDTPTELILYIKRANPGQGKVDIVAHDPLADPLQDINIQPGNAKTYMVKKGQYIQIQDIKGRECSDFQAFSMRALDKVLERDIDPTTTRSLM